MENLFIIICKVIGSIGGGAVIVIGLSSWLGKIWAERILAKDKKKYETEIETVKAKFVEELENIKVKNKKTLFVTKLQYEKEFSILQELWTKLFLCVQSSIGLYKRLEDIPVDHSKKLEFNKDKFYEYSRKYNEYVITTNKFEPFYNNEFDIHFERIRADCSRIGSIFKTYELDVHLSQTYEFARDTTKSKEEGVLVYNTLPSNITTNTERLRNLIREYLKGLQTFE